MLKEISIRNFTLIDNLNISFSKGLNVIMGETGSGKSNIIDALSILMGERASKDKIRHGYDTAYLSCAIDISDNRNLINFLINEGIYIEGELLVISRILSKKSSTISKVNDQIVTANILKNISKFLIDIYGQFENQLILSKAEQLKFIDEMVKVNKKNKELYEEFKFSYNEYLEALNRLEEFKKSPQEINRNTEFLEYQIEDIEKSNILTINEDEVFNRLEIIEHTQVLQENSNAIFTLIDNTNGGALYNLSKAIELSKDIASIDSDFNEINDRIESLSIECDDIRREVQYYSDSIYFDQEEFLNLDSKRNMIFEMKRKYGQTIEEISDFYNNALNTLDSIRNYESILLDLEKSVKLSFDKSYNLASEISKIRHVFAKKFEEKVLDELIDLDMGDSKFKIDFKETGLNSNGIDSINFLISFNKNEDLKDFNSVASGGEISRFMLAIKSIEAGIDKTPILIFDEIDTGISGNAGSVVGDKLKELSNSRTIICISHLPQIIAKADHQYLVYKTEENEKITSKTKLLNIEERVIELAKTIEGDYFSSETLDTARKMIINNIGEN